MKWRACSQGITYDADDGFVVYFDPDSGRTHLISEVAIWLMAELGTRPLTTEQLESRIVSQVESVTVQETEELAAALIKELQSFDLIEAI
jgi:hypothetical protein